MNFSRYIGPEKTRLTIKYLIGIMLISSILFPIASLILHSYHLYGPWEIFSLSVWGIKKGFFWQPLTYFFLQPGGLSFFALISLLFNLLILWVVGSLLLEEFGRRQFLGLYLSTGIFGGLVALLVMLFLNYSFFLAGASSLLMALLFVTAMLMPDLELALFFILRIKIKWVIFIFLGLSLLSSLASSQWIMFVNEMSAIIWAYFYGVILLHLKSPFPFTHSFDMFLKEHTFALHSLLKTKRFSKKILHFEDEVFMDQMLEKIAKEGEASLSRKERRRMKKISRRKNR